MSFGVWLESYACHLLTFPIGFDFKKMATFWARIHTAQLILPCMYFDLCNLSKGGLYSEGTAYVISPNR